MHTCNVIALLLFTTIVCAQNIELKIKVENLKREVRDKHDLLGKARSVRRIPAPPLPRPHPREVREKHDRPGQSGPPLPRLSRPTPREVRDKHDLLGKARSVRATPAPPLGRCATNTICSARPGQSVRPTPAPIHSTILLSPLSRVPEETLLVLPWEESRV